MESLSRIPRIGSIVAVLTLLAVATSLEAGKPWHSVMADSDFVGECFTTALAGPSAAIPGGTSCFGTTQFVPNSANVLRVTWSTAGDSHDGASVRLACRIRPASTGVWSWCNPTGSGAAPGDYITKNKVPSGTGATNCNDGGGGDGDCHDNSIEVTWCVPIQGDDVFDIDLRLAPGALPAGAGIPIAYVEASYFFIDSSKVDSQCGAGDASATTPF